MPQTSSLPAQSVRSKKPRWAAVLLTLALSLSGSIAGPTVTAAALPQSTPTPLTQEEGCKEDQGLMHIDVNDPHFYETQILQAGVYPNYATDSTVLFSFSPCQFYQGDYDEIAAEISRIQRLASLAAQASSSSWKSPVAKTHYQNIARSYVADLLMVALVEPMVEVNNTGYIELFTEVWNREYTPRAIAEIAQTVRWHITFIGEKEEHVDEIYTYFERGFLFTNVKLNEVELDELVSPKLELKRLRAMTILAPGDVFPWLSSYEKLLLASKKVVMPVFYKNYRTSILSSFSALVRDAA